MTAKKKSSSTRETSRKSSTNKSSTRKPTVQEVRQVEEFRMEIIMWIIIACSLLLFISNFGVGGVVGGAVSTFLFGVFGSIAYVFPLYV